MDIWRGCWKHSEVWGKARSKLTTKKVKAFFSILRSPGGAAGLKGSEDVWMIRRLEQKMCASGLLRSSFYTVSIKITIYQQRRKLM